MGRLHPFTAVRDSLTYAVQVGSFAFFAVAMGSSVGGLPLDLLFVLTPIGVVAGAGFAVARYLVFEYELGESALHITSGVVQRQQREIPLGRIQNVDVEQSVLQRALGLAVVRFETAGGGQTEAVLRMVSNEEADRLRAELRRRKQQRAEAERAAGETDQRAGDADQATAEGEQATGAAGQAGHGTSAASDGEAGGATAGTADAAAPTGAAAAGIGDEEPTVLFELSTTDLLVLSGLTFRWGVLSVVFALPLVGEDAINGLAALVSDLASGNPLAAGGVLVVVTALALAGAWLVSAAITFVNYYGFQLARVGDELVYERGLLQRYSGSIPLEKVQAVTVNANPLMRRFGYAALSVETAGYTPGGNDGGRTPSAVPLADRAAVAEFVATFEDVEDLSVEQPPARARRRYVGRYALAALGLTGLLFGVDRLLWSLGPLWALPLAGVLVAPVAGHLKWVNRGHRDDDDHFVARTGFWNRTTQVVPSYRVQTVFTERTIFQRRWGLASVVADTASSGGLLGRSPTAHDVDDGTADDLHANLRERIQRALAERREQ